MPAWTDFLFEFLRQPGRVGAVAASSPALARTMIDAAEVARAGTVIEIGPGTGAITGALLAALPAGGRCLAIEINPRFAAELRLRFPGLPVRQASVEDAVTLSREEGLGPVDAVVSSLPWAAFPGERQEAGLAAIAGVLADGGRFVTFAYLQGLLLPAGRRFQERMRRRFGKIERTPVVWRNLPPAFVYRAVKGAAPLTGGRPAPAGR